jgi:hypothetical protein
VEDFEQNAESTRRKSFFCAYHIALQNRQGSSGDIKTDELVDCTKTANPAPCTFREEAPQAVESDDPYDGWEEIYRESQNVTHKFGGGDKAEKSVKPMKSGYVQREDRPWLDIWG